jgi:hypothetical protein
MRVCALQRRLLGCLGFAVLGRRFGRFCCKSNFISFFRVILEMDEHFEAAALPALGVLVVAMASLSSEKKKVSKTTSGSRPAHPARPASKLRATTKTGA